tara:strand:- start:340 stop:1971 length:1632 start_codon:yes stop_codon:yes gene_type:complete
MANKKITALTPLTSAASDDVLAIVDVSGTAETKKITVANLTSGIGGAVDSVNTQVGVVVLDTDDINEGATNLYYTDARVDANPDVVANTAKVGITPTQASDIVTNNAKVSNVQSDWNASTGLAEILNKPTIPTVPVDSVNGQTGVVVLDTDDIAEGTTNLYYTEARVDANPDVVANTAKVGITTAQASDIVTNNAKVSNVQSDWNASSGLAVILNKPTIPSGGVTQIVAGTNVTISPTGGTGAVTVNASGGGGGIAAVVDDTTPQLGGNLDVQAFQIDTSTTNGNIVVAPNGTGVLEVEGDTNDGAIQLNCNQNTHGVKIQSPPHSAAASYTLVLPDDTGTNGQVLTTDGSGNLSFTTASGGGGLSETPLANISARFMWSSADGNERIHVGQTSYGPFNYYSFTSEPFSASLREWSSSATVNVTTATTDVFGPQSYGFYVPNVGKKVKVRVTYRMNAGAGLDWGFSMWDCPPPSNGSVSNNTLTLRGQSTTQITQSTGNQIWISEFTTTNAISDKYLFFLAESRSPSLSTTTYTYANLTFTLV